MFFYDSDRTLLNTILTQLVSLNKGFTKMALDTSKLLAAVAEENTELKSWEALSAAQTEALKSLAASLAAAIAANDPVALAQVQTDIDKAATDLSADNAEAADAIAKNTPAA